MNANFRQRLRAGDTLLGTIVTLEAPEVVETLCHIGYDWLFIETEHAPLAPPAVQRMVQTAANTPCVVRQSRGDEISIKRALDAGAAGIIVPQVNSAAYARLIVSYAKFAPMGSRGFGLSRASMYGLNAEEYVARANDSRRSSCSLNMSTRWRTSTRSVRSRVWTRSSSGPMTCRRASTK